MFHPLSQYPGAFIAAGLSDNLDSSETHIEGAGMITPDNAELDAAKDRNSQYYF